MNIGLHDRSSQSSSRAVPGLMTTVHISPVSLLPSPFSAVMSHRTTLPHFCSARRRVGRHPVAQRVGADHEAVETVGSHLLILSGQTRADLNVIFESIYLRPTRLDLGYHSLLLPRRTDSPLPASARQPCGPRPHIYTGNGKPPRPENYCHSYGRNGNVRMDGLEGCHIGWALADPDDPNGGAPSRSR